MKTVYGIMIQDADRHTTHIPELYMNPENARQRRDAELEHLAVEKKLVSNPVLEPENSKVTKMLCGMFGSMLFVGKIIEFIVPTDYQTCDCSPI